MIALVAVMLAFIAWNGIQLFIANGVPLDHVLSTRWFPDSTKDPSFGLLPFITGTLGVTTVGVMIGAPLAIGLALFLSEVASSRTRAVVQPALEVFVGIPSVVWGWLGIITLVPFLRTTFGWAGFSLGFSWFAGSLVLAIMILPTITAVSFDALRAVPQELRMGAYGLGATRWQAIRRVLLPAGRAGLITAVVLGTTRAAGEALAVQMVIGNRPTMPTSLTQPLSTLTSQITLDMGNTVFGEAWNNALWTMGLMLMVISLGFVIIVRRLGGREWTRCPPASDAIPRSRRRAARIEPQPSSCGRSRS